MTENPILELAKELISRPSVTPDDQTANNCWPNACKKIGFAVKSFISATPKTFGCAAVLRLRCSLCRTYSTLCRQVLLKNGIRLRLNRPSVKTVCRRNAARRDMKTSIACFVTACERFRCRNNPDHQGGIALLITSDEERAMRWMAQTKVVDVLKARGELIDYCIVGEPTAVDKLGDMLKTADAARCRAI